jgi:arginyl-tRNA synthetase
MNDTHIFKRYLGHVRDAVIELERDGQLPNGLDASRVVVEPPRDPDHGDLSSNVGMVLAKNAKMPPARLADLVGNLLVRNKTLGIQSYTVDGPGFLNLRLASTSWHDELRAALVAGPSFGDSAMGQGHPVNVEYVSANPTGPLHVGHCRGAVVGDALAALLEKAGFAVTREYYINDAGAQVDVLARSFELRYREALGEAIGEIPEGLYPGEYLKEAAQKFAAEIKAKGEPAPVGLEAFRSVALGMMMALVREDLAALGVAQEKFSSEKSIVSSGAVDRALADLEARDLIYVGVLEPPKGKTPEDWEPRPQTLFKSTRFGDDVDRPLKKSDGSWTYFANDIAYHFDKFQRGFTTMIDVWGADHSGYIKRMQAAVTALSDGEAALDVKICQLVNLLDNGEPVKMSKRAGTFVTLRDVIDRVGKDVVRFIMLTRRNDATLEFDFAKVTEQSKDNPVFYVQYAHARASSVLRHAAEEFAGRDLSPQALAAVGLGGLTDPAELALMRQIANWPRLVEAAAEAHEPHRVAFYLSELAASFHALWNKGRDEAELRFIRSEEPELTLARLALISGLKITIAAGLAVLGVEPAEEMR